jgi:hypothetical protein
MNSRVAELVRIEAGLKGLRVDPTFTARTDSYMQRYFHGRPEAETTIVEAYLAQAAIRIARTEGKSQLDGEDFKAAVWLFHHREQLDDAGAHAGLVALLAESTRKSWERGLLMENFASHLNQWLKK